MAYKALYRTYRPADFDEIAGQEHITKTFRNALVKNKIAHAYLFSGPRGTGKTSIAKIIAKAVNCEKAPVENPCNECDICLGIENNTINDVIEIDAASNNGVDEIREIRDKVKYLPGVGKYKVYIIDEVHMLSTGAFNALLKTLEEPPKHVIFILATTEPHKIPPTIHSRCQRFDFRGVSIPDMIKTLNIIIKKENIGIEKEAIKVIAESAEGGMRDAISLLDQVVSYSNENVTTSDVHAIRGTVSNEKLLKIANAIYENNSVEAIKQLDDLIMLGKEAPRLVENLIKFYRDVLIYKNVNIEYDDHLIYKDEKFIGLSKKISNNMIFYYIDCLNKAQNDMKWTSNAKLYMELALIKMVDKVEKQEIYYDDEIASLKTKFEGLNEKIDVLDNRQFVTNEPIIKESVKEIKPISEEPLVNPFDETFEENEAEVENSVDEEFKGILEEENNESDVEKIIDPKPLYTEDDIDRSEKDEKIEETNIFNTPVPETVIKKVIPYQTFDIRYVEDVLNNAKREVKVTMNMKWYDIERATAPADLIYAKMITEGRLVATDGKMIIIQYANPSICNRMMKPEIKEKIVGMLSEFFNVKIDYLALPEVVWQEKSQEFIKKWKRGEKNIKLTPIRHPELRDMPIIDHEVEDMTPDSVKEAISLFGSDIVKVKKGD